ncbi:MOSC domain-containing protein [Streptomyces sp. Ag109_O5-10]|uniref:MOSC domain-containing protein n=1 Tax=Streptomyces sp. Ag109_O5-10 TaxID=1855349 RepID=UPI000B88E4E2|nr:MOSC domain-containing protein [Streptomyces sp. Ag109_O5-10]
MARLLSVNVGMPKDVPWQGRTVRTGAWKSPVDGSRMVRRLNVEGDGQGDLAGHGGEIRAVLVYQLESYRYWRKQLGRDDLAFGMFGENFTVDGLPDEEVCIGDRYRVGEAEFEVTQPRVTCYRVGMRLGEPAMASLLVAHHRPGFYLRVITEGRVRAGDETTRTRRGPEELSVADTDALLYLPGRDPAKLRAALRIPALSPGWQQSFRELAAGQSGPPAAPEPGPPGFRPMRVARTAPETPDVSSVHLATTDGTPPPAARPGQYLSLRLAVDADAYLCGPTAFMDDLSGHLRELGLRPERIRTERFGALGAVNPGVTPTAPVRPHQPPGPPGPGPLVTFTRSGITTPWSPAHASLLELAEACSVPTRWSCRTGVCHTCVTPVLTGDTSYTTPPLGLPEPGTVLICCGTPATEVVLDL